MKTVLKFLAPYWWAILILLAFLCGQVWASLQLPNYMAAIVNDGIVGQNMNLIWHKGLLMLLVTFAGGVCTVGAGFVAARVGTGFSLNLRRAIFAKVESFGLHELDQFSTASLLTRTTNDIQQLQMTLILIMRMILQAPIMAVGAIFNALHTAPNMAWTIGLGIACLFSLIIVIFAVVLPKFKLVQKLVDRLNLVARENLTGLRIIRAFRREDYEEKKFNAANGDLTKLQLFVNRTISLMQPVMMMILNGMVLLIVWVGAHLVETNDLQIGNILAFMQYAMQTIMSFLFLAMLMVFLPRAQVSAGRVAEVLNTKLSVRPPRKPLEPDPSKKGLVEFKNVTFNYGDTSETPVLSNISFTARPGETTAFIGSTGSGKSTLINLIPRFYDVTAGQVLVDGVDVRKLSSKDLVERIGYVPQKGVLFSGTVASNIKYGAPDISDGEVETAAKVAQADFIKDLDGQFRHQIAQGGGNVSGGQKQRLAITRAIAKRPEIYIFDDSFSALDYKTDSALRAALKPITKKSTVLIVAQRISTIKHSEQIIVLDEGQIVGIGTHTDLLKNCPVYQEIASSQLSDAEMAAEMAEAEIKAPKRPIKTKSVRAAEVKPAVKRPASKTKPAKKSLKNSRQNRKGGRNA
ncbi:MAG: ABC transporter ATP-binding protein/permease [Candidatus Nomurabacteria bacterium]|jgi:ATP-binding cassette subfamily B protein|nr:ABC transporter ATP-binding protein/permease [Candidatus Nomurabacteria bacterium]